MKLTIACISLAALVVAQPAYADVYTEGVPQFVLQGMSTKCAAWAQHQVNLINGSDDGSVLAMQVRCIHEDAQAWLSLNEMGLVDDPAGPAANVVPAKFDEDNIALFLKDLK